ncbi:MAG: glycosyl transferase family 1, partial [Hydrogenophaga sp.]
MNFLFIHQNFPGQFRHLAPALAAAGHRVLALRIVSEATGPLPAVQVWRGVQVVSYSVAGRNTRGLHPWLQDMETKTLRAEACWRAMRALQAQGFEPDVVIGHPGWGEPLFVKQVWPETKLGLYAEFFYRADGADMGFDPEFAPQDAAADACRLQMKNLNHLAHLDQADGALSPTQWQADTFPAGWRERISVAHDGIDTAVLCPNSAVVFPLPNAGRALTREDEVVTFVARHLEPYRGFHVL